MTTNLGAKIIETESGIEARKPDFDNIQTIPDPVYGWEPVPEPEKDPELFKRVTQLVNDELKNFFRPEFLNRIDEIIVFSHLTRVDIWNICGLMVDQVKNRIEEKEITLDVDIAAKAFLADVGYDPVYGARPLRRAIMNYLEDILAETCLSDTLYPGTIIYVRRKRNPDNFRVYLNELSVEVDTSFVNSAVLPKTQYSKTKF